MIKLATTELRVGVSLTPAAGSPTCRITVPSSQIGTRMSLNNPAIPSTFLPLRASTNWPSCCNVAASTNRTAEMSASTAAISHLTLPHR